MRPILPLAISAFVLSCHGTSEHGTGSVRDQALADLDTLIAHAERHERGNAAASHRTARRAMIVADSLADPKRHARAATSALFTALLMDSTAYFEETAPRTRRELDSLGDGAALSRHLRRVGDGLYRKAQNERSRSHFDEALAVARRAQAGVELAGVLTAYGTLLLETATPTEGIAMQRAALHVLDSIGVDGMPRIATYGNMAYAMGWAGEPDSAIKYHEAAIALITDDPDDRILAWNLMNLGVAQVDKAQYALALQHLQQAHDLHVRAGRTFETAACVYYMAYSHEQVSPPPQVIAAFERSIAMHDSLAMAHRSMAGLAELARYLIELDSARCAESGLTMAQRDTMALTHSRKAMALVRTYDYQNQLSDILDRASDVERLCGNLDSAVAYARESIAIREELNSPGRAAGSYKDLGMALHAQGRYKEAEAALLTGLERIRTAPHVQNEATLRYALQQLYADMGQPGKAYPHLLRFHRINTNTFSETQRQELVQRDLQWQFDRRQMADSLAAAQRVKAEKDQREIAELRAARATTRTWLVGGGTLLLFGGGTWLVAMDRRRRRERFAKDAALLEARALRAQMDPHFIGNSLHAINSYLLSNEPQAASALLSRFARWMRSTLENNRRDEVPLGDEVEAARTFLALERTRTGGKFEFTVTLPQDDTLLRCHIPTMLIQPVLENAVKHGITPMEGKGHIALRVEETEDGVAIIVEDDGVGRHRSASNGPKHRSLSTTITEERLALLSGRTGKRASVQMEDLSPGTRVVLRLPV